MSCSREYNRAVKIAWALFIVLAGRAVASGTTQAPILIKRPPQARTQQEYGDYVADYAVTGGPAAEKAANEFAAQYPQSELRQYLYSKALHEYQNENNPLKMLAMGEKVLSLDPENSIALVLTATVLADSLSDGDQDFRQKVSDIRKNCTHALETVDTGFTLPPGASQEQIANYKRTLQSLAYSALGIMELKTHDDAGAERSETSVGRLIWGKPSLTPISGITWHFRRTIWQAPQPAKRASTKNTSRLSEQWTGHCNTPRQIPVLKSWRKRNVNDYRNWRRPRRNDCLTLGR